MSLYQFSESNQPLLKRCLEAATSTNSTNKWIQNFSQHNRNTEITDQIQDNCLKNTTNEDIGNKTCYRENMEVDEQSIFVPVIVKIEREESWRELLELDTDSNFEVIVEKCLVNPNLLVYLAEELPIVSVEKLCKHIYETENVNSSFLEKFYNIFIPQFLNREPTRLSIDLLVKAKCYNSVLFKDLLITIVNNNSLPNKLLYDLVCTFNNNEQKGFMLTLNQADITKDVFTHHMSTIHTAYKNGEKNNLIQDYVLKNLIRLSEKCASDKMYGRFLLDFLKFHKEYRTNILEIEKLVGTHMSAFRKPCLNVLNEIKSVCEDEFK